MSKMKVGAKGRLGLVAGASLALVAVLVAMLAPTAGADRARLRLDRDLQAVKAATARYHSLQQAQSAGYSTEHEPCVQSPLGAMGIHAVNQALVMDPAIDPLRPEIVLYLPDRNGNLKMIGLEYFQVALVNTPSGPRPWFGLPGDPEAPPPGGFVNPAPVLFGQTFDGPMSGHNPMMPWHYDLHVWLWADNPSGMFAMFNPTLTCLA